MLNQVGVCVDATGEPRAEVRERELREPGPDRVEALVVLEGGQGPVCSEGVCW
ncbi:hypothetical protein ACOALZ_18255 [Nocardiopsis algeriensis]|uniref:Uncharacterized protein n=1 Tax=Nocardiopsis algeriensis TaxID=1478215 RepID=A0A841IMF2_9ACTN|nr:hypothetical protein [Nocardiopsis algeriensis]